MAGRFGVALRACVVQQQVTEGFADGARAGGLSGTNPSHKDGEACVGRSDGAGKSSANFRGLFAHAFESGELTVLASVASKDQWSDLWLQLQTQMGGGEPESLHGAAGFNVVVNVFGCGLRADDEMCGTCQAGN